MHHQRGQLMQCNPLLPAVSKWVNVVVGRKRCRAETPEQVHHGQVKLAVAAVDRRINQPARTPVVNKTVSCPQITMNKRWWFVNRPETLKVSGNLFDPRNRDGIKYL